MREFTDSAIILRIGLFHESDLWVQLFSRTQGIFTVFAFGGAKSRKRFCGCLDIFNTIQCHIGSSRNGKYQYLKEATLMEGACNLRQDWQAMGLAANCILFLLAMPISAENASECYDVLLSFKARLQMPLDNLAFPALLFRLRIASAMGFQPALRTCGSCGKTVNAEAVFNAQEGQVFCTDCAGNLAAEQRRNSFGISGKCLDFLRAACAELPGQWNLKVLDAAEIRQGGRIIDNFIQYHLGIAWDNGAFRHI